MKLQQLRYLAAVAQNNLNISAAAERLYTSQPGISKQIKLLEDELGMALFRRSGRSLTAMTDAGELVLERANRVLREVENIRRVTADLRGTEEGTLSIATTDTQARYVLPGVISRFRQRFPNVRIELHQGTAEQIDSLFSEGEVDLAIASGSSTPAGAITYPCYHWRPVVVVPEGHPLSEIDEAGIEEIAEYPLITYSFSTRPGSSLLRPFDDAGLEPRVALTARDADIIKTHVKLGLGVGIIAGMAFDPDNDLGLRAIEFDGLFPEVTTWVAVRRGLHLRSHAVTFIEYFAPSLAGKITTEVM